VLVVVQIAEIAKNWSEDSLILLPTWQLKHLQEMNTDGLLESPKDYAVAAKTIA
jgi:hypothetical protein